MKIIDIINEEIKLIDETYASINEIKKFASDVIDKIAEINFDVLSRNNVIYYLYGTYLNAVDSSKYKEIKDFIDNTNIYVYVNNMNKPYLHGSYGMIYDKNYNPIIEREINIYVRDINEVFDKINTNYKENPNYSAKDLYMNIFYSLYSTLIHELQHAYDDYRSKNRIYHTRKFDTFNKHELKKIEASKNNEIANDIQQGLRYLNLQHEIWARFTQALYHTHFTTLEFTDDDKGYYFKMKDVHDVVKDFKRNFELFRVLSDKMKRKLISKIVQFWHIEKEKLENGDS